MHMYTHMHLFKLLSYVPKIILKNRATLLSTTVLTQRIEPAKIKKRDNYFVRRDRYDTICLLFRSSIAFNKEPQSKVSTFTSVAFRVRRARRINEEQKKGVRDDRELVNRKTCTGSGEAGGWRAEDRGDYSDGRRNPRRQDERREKPRN